jgi:hypothetical protein
MKDNRVQVCAACRTMLPTRVPRGEKLMAVSTEISRLRRATEDFVANVNVDLRAKAGLSSADKRTLRAEIEICTQLLDELRSKLGG